MNKTKKVVIALSTLTVIAMLSACNNESTLNSSKEKVQQSLTQASEKTNSGIVITAEEQKYLNTVQEYLHGMDKALTSIGGLLDRIEDKGTKEWQDEYVEAAAVIIIYDETIQKTIPPTRLQEVHKYFTKALKQQDDAIMILTESLGNSDVDKADQAQELFKQSKLSLAWVNVEIARFKEGKQ